MIKYLYLYYYCILYMYITIDYVNSAYTTMQNNKTVKKTW